MSGYMQWGLAVFENDTPENNTFYPNGIYLAFDVYLLDNWHGRIQISFHDVPGADGSRFINGGNYSVARVQDAYIEYSCSCPEPYFNVRVGQTHVPFTLAGQYAETEGIAIWSAPFIGAWSHGRDPGIMIWGRISDMLEYKASIHNGEGANRLNTTDDFLMALSARIYPLTYSENSQTYFHVGFIRTRDTDNNNGSGTLGSAFLTTPWGRRVFGDNRLGADDAATRGWRTGVDTGLRVDMPLDPEKASSIRAELEFMYMVWERKLTTGRLPFLQGYGVSFGLRYHMNLTPGVEGEGLFPLFQFSYSDIDNKDTDDVAGNIRGQRVYTYTFGLGYAFNKFVNISFNWVMVNLAEQDLYGPVPARNDRTNPATGIPNFGSDDLEHAWFVQLTAQF